MLLDLVEDGFEVREGLLSRVASGHSPTVVRSGFFEDPDRVLVVGAHGGETHSVAMLLQHDRDRRTRLHQRKPGALLGLRPVGPRPRGAGNLAFCKGNFFRLRSFFKARQDRFGPVEFCFRFREIAFDLPSAQRTLDAHLSKKRFEELRAEKAELTRRDLDICQAIGPKLQDLGLIFVGIDVIGDCLTEIHVTSPTGLQEIDRFNDTKLAAQIWDAIEKRRDADDE